MARIVILSELQSKFAISMLIHNFSIIYAITGSGSIFLMQ